MADGHALVADAGPDVLDLPPCGNVIDSGPKFGLAALANCLLNGQNPVFRTTFVK